MLAFHFDFNTAHYRISYIKERLLKLKQAGYDTIIWELEDFVRFDTVPQAAAPDAVSKDEFKELLAYSRSLNFANVPLLQTLAHVEYVLRSPGCRELAEGDSGYIYCPSNEKVYTFLTRWLTELKEIFYDAPFFHIGCDESHMLGESCRKCNDIIRQQGTSALLIRHITRIREILSALGVRAAIWADMLICHPENISDLPKDLLLFEWRYNIHNDNEKLWCPGHFMQKIEDFPPELRQRYGRFLFPDGEKPGTKPETFYLNDYLKSFGFEVVICPSTSSYGGSIFCGEPELRFKNCFDSLKKSVSLDGCAVTSWSVHLFPYELQDIGILAAGTAASADDPGRKEYCDLYTEEHFGIADSSAFTAMMKALECTALFIDTGSAGHSKAFHRPARDVLLRMLAQLNAGELFNETIKVHELLTRCHAAAQELEKLKAASCRGQEELDEWDLAIRNLTARARFTQIMLQSSLKEQMFFDSISAELAALKAEYASRYSSRLTGQYLENVLYIMYDLPLYALENFPHP